MEIQDILDRVNIVEYISQFCDPELRSDGDYWALSPLSNEKTPSFSINEETGRWYCFSTHKGGNLIDFIKAYYNCEFQTALNILKKYANITDTDEREPIKRLLSSSIAKKYRYRDPFETKPSFSGVVLPKDYMDRYENNPDKLECWRKEGISDASMQKFQVRYDPMSDRIVFPIRSPNGDIVNVCGRTLDPLFKEKKLRKYTYFKQFGALTTIYGLFENMMDIVSAQEIILFEGSKSVMLADGWGIHNTGAILTSHLNPHQFRLLIQLGVRVVFALDAEVDIRKDENIQKLTRYTTVEWVKNQNGVLGDKDAPVDKGESVFRDLYQRRIRLR